MYEGTSENRDYLSENRPLNFNDIFTKLRRNLWRSTSQSLGDFNEGRNYTRKVSAGSNLSEVSHCDNCKTCPEIGRYTGYFAPFQLIPNKFPTYVFVMTVE